MKLRKNVTPQRKSRQDKEVHLFLLQELGRGVHQLEACRAAVTMMGCVFGVFQCQECICLLLSLSLSVFFTGPMFRGATAEITELLEKAADTALSRLDADKVAQWATSVKEVREMQEQLPGQEGITALRLKAEQMFQMVEKKTKASAWKVACQEFLDVPVSADKVVEQNVIEALSTAWVALQGLGEKDFLEIVEASGKDAHEYLVDHVAAGLKLKKHSEDDKKSLLAMLHMIECIAKVLAPKHVCAVSKEE